MRFIRESDYEGSIKAEIKRLLTGTTGDPSTAQINAEDTAISTVRQYLSGRYDCDQIFIPWNGTGTDTRIKHIVKIVKNLALYELYQQTSMRDIPENRKDNYDDAISWLKDVGRGTIKAELPQPADDSFSGDFRFNSKKPLNHKW